MSRVVFDIGGSNLRIARAEGGVLDAIKKVPTPQAPRDAVEIVRAFAAEHAAGDFVGCVPGIVQKGIVVAAKHLPQWDGFAFADELKAACSAQSVRVGNDAALAGIGEARGGAGKGYRSVGYITVSTGVGGALIIDGKVAPRALGHEPGKQLIQYQESRTLESLVCGAALTAEFGKPPEELPPGTVTSRTPALAAGLYNVLRLWSPEILILGGALMNDRTGYALEDVIRELGTMPVELPPIARAAYGDHSALYGAAFVEGEEVF